MDEAGKAGKELGWMEGFMVIAILCFMLATPMILIGIFYDGCRKCQKSWGFWKTVEIMSRESRGPRCPYCIEMIKMFEKQVDTLIDRYQTSILNKGYKIGFLKKARQDVLLERTERAEKAKTSPAVKYQEDYLLERFEQYLSTIMPIWPFSIR
jgi:hypothetical protein